MNDWINCSVKLPKITEEDSFVEVRVLTEHHGKGTCTFGYSGAMGEPMTGSFWLPIRDFKGNVHLENKITHWQYV